MANHFEELRLSLDGGDGFMTGHRVTKGRVLRPVPEWAASDESVQAVILSAFPNWREHQGQLYAASRWAGVITYYFKCSRSYRETAELMGEDPESIRSLIIRIRRAACGMRTDNKPRVKKGQGRPKRTHE